MAKQEGSVKITGTLGSISFYELEGNYYARAKTSLDKKQVMSEPAFEKSRQRMKDFGAASRWCKPLYHNLPAHCKGQGVQQKMTGMAHRLFLQGFSNGEVMELLLAEFANVNG